jgi:hypothetical protein
MRLSATSRTLEADRDVVKNRNTDLIEWNEALSEGVGCSGTRYVLSYERATDTTDRNAGRQWLVSVDGMIICTAESAQDGLARTEGLEALRCILVGQSDQISDEHCRVAELLASEMLDAAVEALRLPQHLENEGDLLRNVDALQALSEAVRAESLNRQRGGTLVHPRH